MAYANVIGPLPTVVVHSRHGHQWQHVANMVGGEHTAPRKWVQAWCTTHGTGSKTRIIELTRSKTCHTNYVSVR